MENTSVARLKGHGKIPRWHGSWNSNNYGTHIEERKQQLKLKFSFHTELSTSDLSVYIYYCNNHCTGLAWDFFGLKSAAVHWNWTFSGPVFDLISLMCILKLIPPQTCLCEKEKLMHLNFYILFLSTQWAHMCGSERGSRTTSALMCTWAVCWKTTLLHKKCKGPSV